MLGFCEHQNAACLLAVVEQQRIAKYGITDQREENENHKEKVDFIFESEEERKRKLVQTLITQHQKVTFKERYHQRPPVSPFIDHFVKQPLEETMGFVGFLKASSKQFEKDEAA